MIELLDKLDHGLSQKTLPSYNARYRLDSSIILCDMKEFMYCLNWNLDKKQINTYSYSGIDTVLKLPVTLQILKAYKSEKHCRMIGGGGHRLLFFCLAGFRSNSFVANGMIVIDFGQTWIVTD